MIIRIKNNERRLTNILYIFNLRINLRFEKRFTKKALRENFYNNNLYIHITRNAKVLKTFTRNNIYLVN